MKKAIAAFLVVALLGIGALVAVVVASGGARSCGDKTVAAVTVTDKEGGKLRVINPPPNSRSSDGRVTVSSPDSHTVRKQGPGRLEVDCR
jgi:hypothetical protein